MDDETYLRGAVIFCETVRAVWLGRNESREDMLVAHKVMSKTIDERMRTELGISYEDWRSHVPSPKAQQEYREVTKRYLTHDPRTPN